MTKDSPASGLPSRTTSGLCALTFSLSLALYTFTLAPTVTLVDSGELIVAAHSLGVAHPPGFPLYTLLAHAATWLPFGNVAQRVNFASALFAALAIAVFAAVSAQMLWREQSLDTAREKIGPTRGERKKAAKMTTRPLTPGSRLPIVPSSDRSFRSRIEGLAVYRGAEPAAPSAVWMSCVPPLVAALLLAFSRTLWSYATIAEVYTLNTLLIMIVFLLMLRWRHTRAAGHRRDGQLYAAAFVFGLGLCVHHVTVGLTLPALAWLVYATAGSGFFRSRHLLWAFLCALAGLSIYAYLPLAARHSPVLNWGDPRTLQRLWWHVTGRQFQAYFVFSFAGIGSQIGVFVSTAARELGPWWLPLAPALCIVGFVSLFRHDRTLFGFVALIVAADLAYALSYDIAEDKAAYYLPTFIAAALAAGWGTRQVLSSARRLPVRAAPAAAFLVMLVPVAALAANFRFNNHRRYFIAHDYVDNILATIEPGGLLLTLDWQVCSPLLYTRLIEQQRRDVAVIDVNLLRRSWYFDYLRQQYPELMARDRAETDAFVEDLEHWEQDPAAYQRDRSLNQRIDRRFHEMLLAFVRRHLTTAPVYVTQDVVLSRDMLAKALAATYELVPQGLVFQLFADRDFHEPATPHLTTRGLADGTLAFDPDDVVTLKVLPVYVGMLYNRGRYLALHKRYDSALAAFQAALALNPGFIPARQALADSLTIGTQSR